MKKLQNEVLGAYEAPLAKELKMETECVLCTSGTLEQFGCIEDVDGWN